MQNSWIPLTAKPGVTQVSRDPCGYWPGQVQGITTKAQFSGPIRSAISTRNVSPLEYTIEAVRDHTGPLQRKVRWFPRYWSSLELGSQGIFAGFPATDPRERRHPCDHY